MTVDCYSNEQYEKWNDSRYAIQLPHELKWEDVVIGDKVIYFEPYENEAIAGVVIKSVYGLSHTIRWTFMCYGKLTSSTSEHHTDWLLKNRLHFYKTDKEELALGLRFNFL